MKKIFFHLCLVLILVGLAADPIHAEVILKSGQTIKGEVVKQTDEYIEIDTGLGVVVTYYLDEIKSVQGVLLEQSQRAPLSSQNENQVDAFQALFPETFKEETQSEEPSSEGSKKQEGIVLPDIIFSEREQSKRQVSAQVEKIEQTVEDLNRDFPSTFAVLREDLRQTVQKSTDKVHQRLELLLAVLQVFPKGIFDPFIVTWVICALPLIVIARKVRVTGTWMALVPGLQFFLLLKMADKSIWWIFYFIIPTVLFFVPYYVPVENPVWYFFGGLFLLIFNALVVPMVLWMNVLRLLQIPSVLGLMMIIPGLNVLLHAYLAIPYKNQRFLTVKFLRLFRKKEPVTSLGGDGASAEDLRRESIRKSTKGRF